jgi:guanylate kinase
MERDGVEYHFITLEQAAMMLEKGEYVEAKKYGTNVYGTSASEIQKAKETGKIAITDLEVQGVAEYKAISANVIAEFILPPNFDEWQRRLHARYGAAGADPADMDRRMRTAITELEEALSKPYYHFVINDDLDTAVAKVDKIAHNHDTFTPVDDTVHQQAAQLLQDLRSHVSLAL